MSKCSLMRLVPLVVDFPLTLMSIYAGSLLNVSGMLKIEAKERTLSVDPTLTLGGCPKDYFILNKGVTRQSTEAIYCTNVRTNYDSFTHLNT